MAIYFNIVDIIFSIFTLIVIISRIPLMFSKKFAKIAFYGNLAQTESDGKGIRFMEIPKSYFKHFYVTSSIFCVFLLFYMVCVYFFDVDVNENIKLGLKSLLGEDEPVPVITALTAMALCTIQCSRRAYESVFMQIFAKSSRMLIIHYMIAHIHYLLCIISIVGRAPLFCGEQIRNSMTWIDITTKILIAPCILLFLYASYEQFRSHAILANLRKSKETGSVVTDAYQIPHGGLFKYTSSPHRLCEVLIYLAFVLLMQTQTHVIIFVWVLINQIHSAFEAHQWYKKTFEDYPSERFAIFPYLL